MTESPPLVPPPSPAADALAPPPRRPRGRPPGALSRRTRERISAIEAALGNATIGAVETPQELLEAIMRCPACAIQDRQKAATVLLAYAVPKPAAQQPAPRHLANLAADLDAAWRRTGRTPPPDGAAGEDDAQQPDAANPPGPLSHLTEEQRQALADMLR